MAKQQAEIKIEGLKELQRDLRKAKDKDLDAELKETHREAAEIVATAARPLVPVRTGKMLGTLRVTATLRSGRIAMGRKSVPYVGPVHFGWGTRPNPARSWRGGPIEPNPFLYDALDKRRAEVVDRFEQSMAKVAEKVNTGSI